MLTQDYLKQILEYNPENGVFTWRVARSNRVKVGAIAGNIGGKGYRQIRIMYRDKKILYYAHRLAWLYVYGIFPEKYIDHINGNKLDNRISNLREVSNSENLHNTHKHKNNNFVGVSFNKEKRKWAAQINVKNRRYRLGYFNTKEEAYITYSEARKILIKKFLQNDFLESIVWTNPQQKEISHGY